MFIRIKGANSHGQLGLGYQSEMCETPQKLSTIPSTLELKSIRKMQGGGTHFTILDDNGKLHASGCNTKGQLGIGSKESKTPITAVINSNVFIDVACGWDSSAAIDANGVAYVWGSNAFNQLGFNSKTSAYFLEPVVLELPHKEKVQKIAFGLRYMCVLCDNQTVYITGRWKDSTNFDIIEYNDTGFYKLKPTPDMNILDISSGSAHIICSSDRFIYAFGDNKYCQGTSKSLSEENKSIRRIQCGWTHNGLQTDDGMVFLWGRNSYGQLAKTNIDRSDELQALTGINAGIDTFHLGSEHGLAISVEGDVFTWGWNEHSNCGNGNVNNV